MAGPTREQIVVLFTRVSEGDIDARNILVEMNLGLVYVQAKKYQNRGMELLDLVGEGSLGLIKAVEDYQPAQGTGFSTYANYWIRNSIRRALARHGFKFKINVDIFKLARKCKVAGVLEEVEEIQKFLKCRTKTALNIIDCMRATNIESEDFVTDSLISHNFPCLPVDFARLFDKLDDRETAIIRMRYGIHPYREMNFQQIGERLSLSRESIRKIHDVVIDKMKRRL